MKNSKISFLRRFLLWASGHDKETISHCNSSEINRGAIMGTMVIIPAFIGLFSFGYVFYLLTANLYLSVVAGVLWSIVILIIDRALVGYSRSVLNFGALFRLVMALIIGFVVSEPVLLAFFSDAIERDEYALVREKINRQNSAYDKEIANLNKELAGLREEVNVAQEKYQDEMQGISNTQAVGLGPIYRKLEADYKEKAKYLDSREEEINAEIKRIKEEKAEAALSLQQNHDNTNGLLNRIIALDKLSRENEGVFWVVWGTRLFFILIELIPIFIKITSTGYRGMYNKIIDYRDEELDDVMKITSEQRVALLQKQHDYLFKVKMMEYDMSVFKAGIRHEIDKAIFAMEELTKLSAAKNRYAQKIHEKVKPENLKDQALLRLDEIYASLFEIFDLKSRKQTGFSAEMNN